MPQRSLSIPVLMYHKVGQPVASKRDRFLNVSTHDFRRQMRALSRLGYRAVTFADAVAALAAGTPLPRRTFSITFDDGYRCIGDYAAPVLREFGFPATVFVVSSQAGGANIWDRDAGHAVLPLMPWEELKELANSGWEIAGHTRTHPHLDQLDDDSAAEEISRGREDIRARLGVPVDTFCYPFGHYNPRTPGLVRAAGFTGACTTASGISRSGLDPYQLPRVKVAFRDGVAGMLYRLLVRPHLPDLRPRRPR